MSVSSVPTRCSVEARGAPGGPTERCADPCTMVIFGAAGDLSQRKLLPAIYRLACEGLLSPSFRLVGVGRDQLDDDQFRALVRSALDRSDESGPVEEVIWSRLVGHLSFVRGDLGDAATYAALRSRLEVIEAPIPERERNRMFYFAVPPSVFEAIATHLSQSRLAPRIRDAEARPWARVVIEKPFGRSLETAQELNTLVLRLFAEPQIYRIDHYLGKETVQNLIVTRFANSIFEPLWNRQSIAHVQITVAETVGVERRGKYYEEAGVVRDMFQNHLLQLLSLTAMEPPASTQADAVRDEKVKVLRSIRWLSPETIPQMAVRAQYAAGSEDGAQAPGYREEPDVAPDSTTPTFAAVQLMVDNWRWQGVPFYLRSGKRMAKRLSEIVVQFREPPLLMFGRETRAETEPNSLVVRVQPNEGMALRFEVKVPGAAVALTPEIEVAAAEMDFRYAEAFGETTAPAYETLLLDVMLGEQTLFTRSDEVEAAWRVVDPLIAYWETTPPAPMPTYASGSWGPAESDALLARDGYRWRNPG